MIDANAKLVVIGSKNLRAEVGHETLIRVRVKGQEVLRNRIDGIRAEKLEIVERDRRGLGCEEKQELAILQGSITLHAEAIGVKGATAAGAQKAKITGTLRIGRHGGAGCLPLTVAKALVVAEEEGFVLLDGTTESRTKLVAMKRFDGSGEEALGIHSVVAEKFPERTVKLIGAGARHDIGSRTGAMAKFGAGGVGKDTKFRDSVDGRLKNETAVHAIEIVRAIDKEII